MIFQDRNLYLRAVRNVELADKAEQERKIAEEYKNLQLLSQPSTGLSGESAKEVIANEEAVKSLEQQLTPKRKRNVKK